MDSEGVRKLILIPQTQYQQLIQNQVKPTATTKSSLKVSEDAGKDDVEGVKKRDEYEQSGSINSASGPLMAGESNNTLYEPVHEDVFVGKVLQIIQCSYPKPLMKKCENCSYLSFILEVRC